MTKLTECLNTAKGTASSVITLYHGTSVIFDAPIYGIGKDDNDYGSGFYLTESFDRAAEWACEFGGANAYVNKYELDCVKLDMLRLDSLGPLAWIAEVGSHRYKAVGWEKEFVDKYIDMYKPITDADVIVGLRADDAYMSIINAFFQDRFGAFEVERMFNEGDLGAQYFLKSRAAFASIRFIERSEVAGYAFDDTGFRKRNISKIEQRERDMLVNKGFVVPFPSMMHSLDRKLIYNQEGFYE